jgi:hypothetical protein
MNEVSQSTDRLPVCGIIMPISATDGYPTSHWGEVKSIIDDAIGDAGFKPNLVSASDEVTIIHKNIIRNLYENPMVVCDVSSKNPNVMFELGVRLAFDRPTIVIKDERTVYSFDTSPIEHITYPTDLRFHHIVQFKSRLTQKIVGTYEQAQKDPEFSTFLMHFGNFKIKKLSEHEIPQDDFIIKKIVEISDQIADLSANQRATSAKIESGKTLADLMTLADAARTQAAGALRWSNLPSSIITEIADKPVPRSYLSDLTPYVSDSEDT